MFRSSSISSRSPLCTIEVETADLPNYYHQRPTALFRHARPLSPDPTRPKSPRACCEIYLCSVVLYIVAFMSAYSCPTSTRWTRGAGAIPATFALTCCASDAGAALPPCCWAAVTVLAALLLEAALAFSSLVDVVKYQRTCN